MTLVQAFLALTDARQDPATRGRAAERLYRVMLDLAPLLRSRVRMPSSRFDTVFEDAVGTLIERLYDGGQRTLAAGATDSVVRGYLQKGLYNALLDGLRSDARTTPLPEPGEGPGFEPASPDPDAFSALAIAQLRQELEGELLDRFRAWSDKRAAGSGEKQVEALRFLAAATDGGQSMKAWAESLGISHVAAQQRCTRARERLCLALEQWAEEGEVSADKLEIWREVVDHRFRIRQAAVSKAGTGRPTNVENDHG